MGMGIGGVVGAIVGMGSGAIGEVVEGGLGTAGQSSTRGSSRVV